MAVDESFEAWNPLGSANSVEGEIKELLGLFDTPAFVRRGTDLEFALRRLRDRLGRDRLDKLDMVRLRLKQWSKMAVGFDDFQGVFRATIEPLFALSYAEVPMWGTQPGSPRARRAVANDLVKSVVRFNKRWAETLDSLRLDPLNQQIDKYNKYYVLEKECVLGSSKLAARHFVPKERLTIERLLLEFPALPEVERC